MQRPLRYVSRRFWEEKEKVQLFGPPKFYFSPPLNDTLCRHSSRSTLLPPATTRSLSINHSI